jgi:cutinase
VVIFGDPDNGTAVANIDPSKVLVICHSGDDICKGEIITTSEHFDVSTLSLDERRCERKRANEG